MIEKLLRRIANRGAKYAESAPLCVIEAGSHGPDVSHSSGSAHDPFSTSYPASARVRSVHSGHTQPGIDNAWRQACERYALHRQSGGHIADQPAYFAHWGVAQMAVAQMLWAEHERLSLGSVTIHCGDELLAVLQPSELRVALYAKSYTSHAPLIMKQWPVGQQTSWPKGKEFAVYPLHALLWFYGQVYSSAPDLLPEEMGEKLIQLRRFPPVEPAALEMRHLVLIHIFSGGALSFAQLQKQIPPELASNLCADLASLYFTGSLRLLP